MPKYKPADYEVLRRRCVGLDQAGWKQGPIAQALGLTQGWVSQTLKKYREQGPLALQWRKPPGASTRLTPDQLCQLVEELNKGVEHQGFAEAFGRGLLLMKSSRSYLMSVMIPLKWVGY